MDTIPYRLRHLLSAIRADLVRLLTVWRTLVFSGDSEAHPVWGRWRPETVGESLVYWAWSIVGLLLIVGVYPFALTGLWLRYVAGRIDRVTAARGILTILGIVAVAWGLLTVVAWSQLPTAGFQAVLAASVMATASTGFAWWFARNGGRALTVLVAYPFAVAAIVLPPVTAALFSPTLGAVILPGSTSVAIWLLDTVLVVGGLNAVLREQFTLSGFAFVGMWFGIAAPVGWLVGLLVALANVLRPRDDRPTAITDQYMSERR